MYTRMCGSILSKTYIEARASEETYGNTCMCTHRRARIYLKKGSLPTKNWSLAAESGAGPPRFMESSSCRTNIQRLPFLNGFRDVGFKDLVGMLGLGLGMYLLVVSRFSSLPNTRKIQPGLLTTGDPGIMSFCWGNRTCALPPSSNCL